MAKPRRTAKRAAPKKRATPRLRGGKKKAAPKKRAARKAASVDVYVQLLPSPMQMIVNRVRALVAAASPEAIETLKWAQPVYEANGPFAYIKAHPGHVTFGFWRGALLEAPEGVALEGDGVAMRHLKLASVSDIQDEVIKALVRQAVLLNSRLGTPTRR